MQTDPGPSPKNFKVARDLQEDEMDLKEKHVHIDEKIGVCVPTFHHLYLILEWQEPHTTVDWLTIAIVLPSGIGSGDFKVRIVEDGDVVELTFKWPPPVTDVQFLHKKWLELTNASKDTTVEASAATISANDFSSHHPKILGFEKALRDLRGNRSDNVIALRALISNSL